MTINISQEDFGTLCICAIRYCHGREIYMPSLVQSICKAHLEGEQRMYDYEDLILMYQDWESEYDECSDCEYGKPDLCEDQCMMIHEAKWKIEKD